MPLLPRKAVLAVAAVIDVAMRDHGQPISAKTLAARHGLPPRHLEPVLQALVRCGILNGIRGLAGGGLAGGMEVEAVRGKGACRTGSGRAGAARSGAGE